MTKDDIIDMAQEAGFVEYELDDGTTNAFDIRYQRFANLVAEHEREACEMAVEDIARKYQQAHEVSAENVADACAYAIRARGNT
jgi:TATA-binding protein-associated factor Taf7